MEGRSERRDSPEIHIRNETKYFLTDLLYNNQKTQWYISNWAILLPAKYGNYALSLGPNFFNEK